VSELKTLSLILSPFISIMLSPPPYVKNPLAISELLLIKMFLKDNDSPILYISIIETFSLVLFLIVFSLKVKS